MKTVPIKIPVSLAARITDDKVLLNKLINTWLQERYPPNRWWIIGPPRNAMSNGYPYLVGRPTGIHGRTTARDLRIGHIEFIRGYSSVKNGQDYILKDRIQYRWGETPVKFKTFMKRLKKDITEASVDYE